MHLCMGIWFIQKCLAWRGRRRHLASTAPTPRGISGVRGEAALPQLLNSPQKGFWAVTVPPPCSGWEGLGIYLSPFEEGKMPGCQCWLLQVLAVALCCHWCCHHWLLPVLAIWRKKAPGLIGQLRTKMMITSAWSSVIFTSVFLKCKIKGKA